MRNSQHAISAFSEDQLYSRKFRSLSARDLLDARDQFHVHLVHKENVIATAIGLYLIRDDDADATDHRKMADSVKKRGKLGPRTLTNASSRDWSWPCVLVFVSEWKTAAELRHKPESIVPPFLYLEDGRIIPVCVVLASVSEMPARSVDPSRLVADQLEGGAPIFVETQGQRRMGSVGCLVTDGTDYFALTNRHVAGEGGREVKAVFNGLPRVVGTTEPTEMLGELTFSDLYPTLAGRDTVVHLDAGLVRVANVSDWSPTVGGLTVGRMADFSGDTASLDWIGTPLVAHGAASGQLFGEVRALFYRYKSVGGREYVSEFLIGNRTAHDAQPSRRQEPLALMTVPGDSGTVWCLEPQRRGDVLRPVALEWGGQRLGNDPRSPSYLQFALASSLAVVCRELGLDLVSDFRAEHTQYWGAVGHFKIAQQACFQVQDQDLGKFLTANLDNISFADNATLLEATHQQANHFVPLSDVPDIVWKTNVNKVNKAVTRAQENWNHFADMDLPGASGQTLLDLFAKDQKSLEWSTWTAFYASAPRPSAAKTKPLSHGSLPFRVWQIFNALQQLAQKKDKVRFLCAAGIIAHYVGDACQPLHCSQHADGLNGASTGVHSTYEDNMVEAFADRIAAGIDQIFTNQQFKPATIRTGRDAALAVVELMQRCHQALPPESICESYNQARPGTHTSATKSADVLQALWKDCGQGTITCIADGIRTLASLWQAAVGKDASWLTGKLDGEKDLRPIYEDTGFLPSLHLDHYTQAMIPGSDAPATAAAAAHAHPAAAAPAPKKAAPKKRPAKKPAHAAKR